MRAVRAQLVLSKVAALLDRYDDEPDVVWSDIEAMQRDNRIGELYFCT